MTFFNDAWTWIAANYGLILLIAAFLGAIIYSRIKEQYAQQKTEQKTQSPFLDLHSNPSSPFVQNAYDAATAESSLQKQLVLAQQWINYLEKQAVKISEEQEQLDQQYAQRRTDLAQQKQLLSIKYTGWQNQVAQLKRMMPQTKSK